ncbi:hypothetical protein IWQ51_004234 [Labrenzia sp. EL_142]|nr:hypothetical protein [Labrenzia sp. EL_142]
MVHASFCVVALKKTIARFGPPEIMGIDKGWRFTGSVWVTTPTEAGVHISMVGRGRCMDSIFFESFWRSLRQNTDFLERIHFNPSDIQHL